MAEDYIRQAQRSVYRGSKRDDNTVPGEKFLCHDTATIKLVNPRGSNEERLTDPNQDT